MEKRFENPFSKLSDEIRDVKVTNIKIQRTSSSVKTGTAHEHEQFVFEQNSKRTRTDFQTFPSIRNGPERKRTQYLKEF